MHTLLPKSLLRVTLVQNSAGAGRQANLDWIEQRLPQCQETDLIVLPEVFAFRGSDEEYRAAAEPLDGTLAVWLRAQAVRTHAWVLAGSVLEREGDRIYNTSLLFDRDGQLVATYRKIHLFSYHSKEKRSLIAGRDVVTTPTELGVIGFSICYDLRFPELYRALVKKGAEIIVCPAAWPYPRLDHWITLNKARAIEGQCYFVGCNQAGAPTPTTTLVGRSMITDPLGEVVAAAGAVEAIIEAVIDVTLVRKIREEYAFSNDILEV